MIAAPRRRRAPRHLGQLPPSEIQDLENWIADWLEQHNVPGSVLGAYSLYEAVKGEYEKARRKLAARKPRKRGQPS